MAQDNLSPNEPIVWSPADAPGSTPMPRDLADKPWQKGGSEKSGNPFQDAQPQDPGAYTSAKILPLLPRILSDVTQ